MAAASRTNSIQTHAFDVKAIISCRALIERHKAGVGQTGPLKRGCLTITKSRSAVSAPTPTTLPLEPLHMPTSRPQGEILLFRKLKISRGACPERSRRARYDLFRESQILFSPDRTRAALSRGICAQYEQA